MNDIKNAPIALSEKDIPFVKIYGTPIKCETKRYLLDLKSLDRPIYFINPTDAGSKYANQNFKGDGNDVLVLNGVSAEQIKIMDKYLADFEAKNGKKAEQMNAKEVEDLLDFLDKNGFNDRFGSNQDYKQRAFIQIEGHMYRRNDGECRGVVVPVGTTYEDAKKKQQANVEGALFVVYLSGGSRITNKPEDYVSIVPNTPIISYAEALIKFKNASQVRGKVR